MYIFVQQIEEYSHYQLFLLRILNSLMSVPIRFYCQVSKKIFPFFKLTNFLRDCSKHPLTVVSCAAEISD